MSSYHTTQQYSSSLPSPFHPPSLSSPFPLLPFFPLPVIIKLMSAGKEGREGKIREFEWYEVETRVREIMSELLQPFNKKQTEDTIKINEIKRSQAQLQKKLEDHDFLLERDQEHPQKPTYIQLQDQQILTIQQSTEQLQIDTHAALAKMDSVLAVYQQRIGQLGELERRVDREAVQRVEEFARMRTGFEGEMEQLVRRMEAQIEEAAQFKNLTKGSVTKMETRMITFDNRLKELEDHHKHTQTDLKRLLQDNTKISEKLTLLEGKVEDFGSRVADREKDTKLSEKFLAKVREVEGELRFQTTFLEQYQPLYTQMMIADTLDSFLEGRQRRRLCIFEEKKFASLHQHILHNQKLTLEDMMGTYSNQIRKIISRNKKYVINLAVAESVRHGGNLYEFRIEDLADIQDPEDSTKKAPPPLDPSEIARIVDQRLTALPEEVRKWVDLQLEPTRTWMAELQEQALVRSMEWDKLHQEGRAATEQVAAKVELEEKHNQQQITKLQRGVETIEMGVSSIRDHIKDILNFSSVINHIVIQDEIDRQGTALYALRSKQEGLPSPAFQLDPNCLTCEHKNSVIVQQAFKMACLTYNPSHIRIDEQLFSREEILQISTNILEKLKKKLVLPQHEHRTVQLMSTREAKEGREGKSGSERRSGSLAQGRQTVREMQTLLPTVGRGRERKNQLSVFY